ncbi:MAG: hypothetical protein ACQESP_08625 [Candidatus Muiribacteriota bacterium]
MTKKIFIEIILLCAVIGFLAGCGSGSDKFGSGDDYLPSLPGSSSVNEKLANAKSYIQQKTESGYSEGLELLTDIQNNPNYVPTPEQSLEIRAGIIYCEIRRDLSPVESTETSSKLEDIIKNASGVKIPSDTFFLLASSYHAQQRDSQALSTLQELGRQDSSVFNPQFVYESEFDIATDGDCHAFMSVLYIGEEENVVTQKNIASDRGTSSLGNGYLSELSKLGY